LKLGIALFFYFLFFSFIPTRSLSRMNWEDPLEAALQCMAHMNVTDKHDDPEARFLVQLLLATMLESGCTFFAREWREGRKEEREREGVETTHRFYKFFVFCFLFLF
jgi:hypothetical protein